MINRYEVITVVGPDGNELNQIHRNDADGTVWVIPPDPANSDYQRYLRWVENPDAPTDNYLTPPDTIEPTQPDEADLTEGND
jgi:hypothetical protein